MSSLSYTAEQALKGQRLDGKVAVVTGGSSGIGLETVRVLALAGAKVYVGSPKTEKASATINALKQDSSAPLDITVLPLDLASFRSIRQFADTLSSIVGDGQIDMLVLNAAVMQTPQWLTREGFEFQTGVNYLGHVELAKILLEGVMLRKAMEGQQARVVIVTCKLPLDNPRALVWRDLNYKTRPYSSVGAYAQSKIALAVWGSDLASRLSRVPNIGVFIVHPGVAITKLNRFLPFFSVLYDMMVAPFVKTVTQAAATSVHCCVAPKLLASNDGGFFDNCKAIKIPEVMCSRTLQENLRVKTDELLASAQVDSHEPIDYNVGRQVFLQFQELYITPILRRLGLGSAQKEKPV